MLKSFSESQKSSLAAMHAALTAAPDQAMKLNVCVVDRSGSTHENKSNWPAHLKCCNRMNALAIPDVDAYVMFATRFLVVPGENGMPSAGNGGTVGESTDTRLALAICMDLVEFHAKKVQRAAARAGRATIQILTDGECNTADAKLWLDVQRRLVEADALLRQRGGGIDIEVVAVSQNKDCEEKWVAKVKDEESDVMKLPGMDVLKHVAGGHTEAALAVCGMIRKVSFSTVVHAIEPWQLRGAATTSMLGFDWPVPMWLWPSEMCADAVRVADTGACSEMDIALDLNRLECKLLEARQIDAELVLLVKHTTDTILYSMSVFGQYMARMNMEKESGAPPEGRCTFSEAIRAARSQAARKESMSLASEKLSEIAIFWQPGVLYVVAPVRFPLRWTVIGSLRDLPGMHIDEKTGAIIGSDRDEYYVVAQTRMYIEGVDPGDAVRMQMRLQLTRLLFADMEDFKARFSKESRDASQMRLCEDMLWVPMRVLWSRFRQMTHATRMAVADLIRTALDKQPVGSDKQAKVSPLGLLRSDHPLSASMEQWMESVHPQAQAAATILAQRGVNDFLDFVAESLGVAHENVSSDTWCCYMCLGDLVRGQAIRTLKTKEGALLTQMVTCEACHKDVCNNIRAHRGKHPVQRDRPFDEEDFTEATVFALDIPESRELLKDLLTEDTADEHPEDMWTGYDHLRTVFGHGHPEGFIALIEERQVLVQAKRDRLPKAYVKTKVHPDSPQVAEAADRAPSERTCTGCKSEHVSRNALFAHLRKSPRCCSSIEDHREMVEAAKRIKPKAELLAQRRRRRERMSDATLPARLLAERKRAAAEEEARSKLAPDQKVAADAAEQKTKEDRRRSKETDRILKEERRTAREARLHAMDTE